MTARRSAIVEFDLDSSVPYTFALVDGAFNASCFGPLAGALIAAGHQVVHPVLPTFDQQATFEDDTEAVKLAIRGKKNVVPVMHSRGSETSRLYAASDLEQFIGGLVVSSGGPHFYTLDRRIPEASQSRHTKEYADAIVSLPNGLTELNRTGAALLYNDVSNVSLLREALWGLRQHRDSSKDQSGPFTLSSDQLPIRVVLGKKERVLNTQRAVKVWQEWAGITPTYIDTGHTPQLARTELFAKYCIDFANKARKGMIAS